MKISFTVFGIPQTQGSMRSMRSNTTGRVVTLHAKSNALKAWRHAVGFEAKKAMEGGFAAPGPIAIAVDFYLPKPKRCKRLLPHVKPDLDKLVRAIGDALAQVIYVDDGQIVELFARKLYGSPPRAEIMVDRKPVAIAKDQVHTTHPTRL